jgi:undecaprenyl-diphosphatase
VIAGSALVALFAALLVLVAAGALDPPSVDSRIVSSVHRFTLDHHMLLTCARAVTVAGAPLLIDLSAAVVGLVLWGTRRRRAAAFVVGVRVVTWLAVLTVKAGVGRHRPILAMPVAHASGPSFPSGHAAGAASLYLPLAIIVLESGRRRWVRRSTGTAAAMACLLVAASRVVLGVHYVSDVLAGLALGAAATAFGLVILRAPTYRD